MSLADTLDPAVQGEPAATPAGKRLAEARQAQNLSAADVARQLKLSVWQVEALEAGRYQQLPGPIFVRGFIRNYARLVKLDPEELLRAAGDSLPQSVPQRETPPSAGIPFPTARAPRWPKYAAAAVVIFGALAVYEFVLNEPQSVTTVHTSAANVQPPAAPVAARAAQTESAPAVASAPPVTPVVPAAQPAGEARAETVVARVEAPQVRAGERRMRFVFREESWVEVRDRQDRVIFSQLNPAGTAQEVAGLPPLSVVVGNSQGVAMTYDDRPVDLARHTKVDVARLTLE